MVSASVATGWCERHCRPWAPPEKSTLSALLCRMEGDAPRRVDGVRGIKTPQDRVDVGVGEGLA